jgi:hypothetical protein
MKSNLLKFAIASVFALGVTLVKPGPVYQIATAYAASCDSLVSNFKRRGKLQFLRVVNRNRRLANYYNSTLKRVRSGSVPATKEMRTAYNRTLASCTNAKCKSDASDI